MQRFYGRMAMEQVHDAAQPMPAHHLCILRSTMHRRGGLSGFRCARTELWCDLVRDG